jgi:hypothetical protein
MKWSVIAECLRTLVRAFWQRPLLCSFPCYLKQSPLASKRTHFSAIRSSNQAKDVGVEQRILAIRWLWVSYTNSLLLYDMAVSVSEHHMVNSCTVVVTDSSSAMVRMWCVLVQFWGAVPSTPRRGMQSPAHAFLRNRWCGPFEGTLPALNETTETLPGKSEVLINRRRS